MLSPMHMHMCPPPYAQARGTCCCADVSRCVVPSIFFPRWKTRGSFCSQSQLKSRETVHLLYLASNRKGRLYGFTAVAVFLRALFASLNKVGRLKASTHLPLSYSWCHYVLYCNSIVSDKTNNFI